MSCAEDKIKRIEMLITPSTLAVFEGVETAWRALDKDTINKLTLSKPNKIESWEHINKILQENENLNNRNDHLILYPNHLEASITSLIPIKDMKIFGAMPLHENLVVLKCGVCGKPILALSHAEHQENCQKVLAKKADGSGKVGANSTLGDKKGKKRKADEENEDGEDKKKGNKKQKAVGRLKGPIDLDKQCGVVGPQEHACTRSLTCKSHSMSSKRAVIGRSQPYDILLSQYQKKNLSIRPNKSNTKIIVDDINDEAADVDSEEETSAIIAALDRARMHPRPLARLADRQPMFAKRRHQLLRIREVLLSALETKGTTSGLVGSGWLNGSNDDTR